MYYILFKYLLTAGMVVIISEVAKRYERIGGLISALPIITFLVMIWMYLEKTPLEKISHHAYYTFWYVIPTLPMFILFPYFLEKFGFWWTIIISISISIGAFLLFALILRRFGIHLL